MSFIKILNSIINESDKKENIVYLDMDGVLADFSSMKKKIITDLYRNDFLDLIKNLKLKDPQKDAFLDRFASHSQDSNINNKNIKISNTKIKGSQDKFWNIITNKDIKFFESLEPLHDNKLIQEINKLKKDYNFKLGILGSTGRPSSHIEFKKQKMKWLEEHKLIQYLDEQHIKFVAGKKLKQNFANQNTILIDDTPINVKQFNEKGNAILYQNIDQTIEDLKQILNKIAS